MEMFNSFLSKKMSEKNFKKFYEEDCHVCEFTVNLISKIQKKGLTLQEVSEKTKLAYKDLVNLKEADYCDYQTVVLLCEFFGVQKPKNCKNV